MAVVQRVAPRLGQALRRLLPHDRPSPL